MFGGNLIITDDTTKFCLIDLHDIKHFDKLKHAHRYIKENNNLSSGALIIDAFKNKTIERFER